MNRRAFVATAGAVAVAGCSAASSPTFDVITHDRGIIEGVSVADYHHPMGDGLRVDAVTLQLASVPHGLEMVTVGSTYTPERHSILPGTDSVDLIASEPWYLPLSIEARGADGELLDFAQIRRAAA